MKIIFYSLFLLIFCSNSLVAQNYYYALEEPQENVTPETAIEINNVSELITGLKSGADLYLKAGNYRLPYMLDLNNLTNVTLTGESGTIIEGDFKTLIRFKGDTKNLKFNNVKFSSTLNQGGADYGGGILYFDNASAEDIYFENCTFTCPNAVTNGLKFVSEGTARSKNINILNCKFLNIGRMAIETQNHTNDGLMRITGITVKNCEFNRMGLQSPFGMAISLSGTGENAVLDNNNIVDSKGRGIENVGWGDITISNNTFASPTTAYEPITCQKDINGPQYIYNVVIKGNSGTVSGSGAHLLGISNCNGAKFINNDLSADALHLVSTINSEFYGNTYYSDGGIGLYIEQDSNNNSFHDNTFVTTADNATTIAIYPPSSGNVFQNNVLKREASGGSNYNDMDGGNQNLDEN